MQKKRVKILSQFKNGKLDILVCTDALARGIDIGRIDYVVSYDCPQFVKTYIHRVGRTARAGSSGTALTLLEKSDEKVFSTMMKEADKTDKVHEEEADHSALDKKAYKTARQKSADILKEEKAAQQEGKKKLAFGARKKNVKVVAAAKKIKKKK